MRQHWSSFLSAGMLLLLASGASAQVIVGPYPGAGGHYGPPPVIVTPGYRPCYPGVVFGPHCFAPGTIIHVPPAQPTPEKVKPPTPMSKTYKSGVKLLSFRFGEKPEFGAPLGNSSAVQVGDIILEANGKPTTTVEELQQAVGDSVGGDGKLKLVVLEPSSKQAYSSELDVKKNRLIFESEKASIDVTVDKVEDKRPKK